MRYPVKLLLDAIHERDLTIAVSNGHTVFRGDLAAITPDLMKAMAFFMPEVLVELGFIPPLGKISDEEPVAVPHDVQFVTADKQGQKHGEPYMWTWIGAERWYYVARNPIPARRQS